MNRMMDISSLIVSRTLWLDSYKSLGGGDTHEYFYISLLYARIVPYRSTYCGRSLVVKRLPSKQQSRFRLPPPAPVNRKTIRKDGFSVVAVWSGSNMLGACYVVIERPCQLFCDVRKQNSDKVYCDCKSAIYPTIDSLLFSGILAYRIAIFINSNCVKRGSLK